MLDRKLLIVSGKGGVGKSAVAASLALLAARRGKRVLCIGMIDDVGLASHFGVERLSYDVRRVHLGIDAMVIDRSKALDEYLHLQLHVPRAAPLSQFTRVFQVLVDTAPGVREIISMGKPIHEVWRGTYDLVVVDAPSLGQLISYLRAPVTVASLVPSGVVQEQALKMRQTLTDPAQAGLLIVTMPEELPVVETIEALDQMGNEPLVDVIGIVVNRVIEPLTVADAVIDDLTDGPPRAAAIHHQHLARDQVEWLKRLPLGPRLPYLFGVFTPGEVAAALVDHWEAPA
jgi:anion-transporting  ArsA/GET3 family ATPase